MKRIIPSLLVYGFLFLLGYSVRTAFQESHYPAVPRKIPVKALYALKKPGGETTFHARHSAPIP